MASERCRNIATTVIKGPCVENLFDLKERLKNLPWAVAPGAGGLRAEFLISIAENFDAYQMDLLESFCMRYFTGALTACYYNVSKEVTTVPTFKLKD